MPYFSVQGDHGYTQIDDTYSNLFLVEKGQPLVGAGQQNVYTGGSPDSPPLIALRGSTGCCVASLDWINGAWRWTVNSVSGNGNGIVYYIFDKMMGGESSYGLVAYNASGVPIFDALKKPLKYESDPRLYETQSNVAWATQPSGKELAWITNGYAWRQSRNNSGGFTTSTFYIGGLRISDAEIRASDIYLTQYSDSGFSQEFYGQGRFSLIDVTGQ